MKIAVIGQPSAEVDALKSANVDVMYGAGRGEDEVIATCVDADIVMCYGLSPFTEKVFASLPRLRFLQQCTVGFDWVDVDAATRHHVIVANSPFFCLEEVSDHAVMLIMASARKLHHHIAAAAEHGWSRVKTIERIGAIHRIKGQTLGFVAFGKIARLTAEKMSGFGMTYLAYDPYLTQDQVKPWNVTLVTLDELCRQSDFISMHALLNDSTRKMFGEPQFRAMKPTAMFVNTSRGGTVDEDALARALRDGWIAGAGLDVLTQEPPDPNNPILKEPNALVLPHTAGYSVEAMADNRAQTVEQVRRVVSGEWPTVCVNPDVRAHARHSPARV
ncbi:MAG: C-terminal binding protein [Chloroflexota bacterium]|nr:MAG: C-terminal binding protein [Chloroflexota bacterium]